MQNFDTVLEKRVARPEYQQRTVVTASGSEKAFDHVNRTLGIGMSWVAGLSMLYLVVHLLRWVSNG